MYLHIAVLSIIVCGVSRLRLEGVKVFLESRSFTEYNQDPSTTHNQDPPPPETTGDTGYWGYILDTGHWGYWILDTGYWILDTGYWTPEDIGHWRVLDPGGY